MIFVRKTMDDFKSDNDKDNDKDNDNDNEYDYDYDYDNDNDNDYDYDYDNDNDKYNNNQLYLVRIAHNSYLLLFFSKMQQKHAAFCKFVKIKHFLVSS